jgi:predicted nucleic acid-binding protein
MFLLDTNVVSELRKARSGQANKKVVAWAKQLPATSLFVSAISILELELGVQLAERRDPRQGAVLRQWLDGNVLVAFRGRVLPIDTEVAVACARLHVPDRRAERDALIGATALVHGLTVATRNVSDFAPMGGVAVHDPWA